MSTNNVFYYQLNEEREARTAKIIESYIAIAQRVGEAIYTDTQYRDIVFERIINAIEAADRPMTTTGMITPESIRKNIQDMFEP